MEQIILEYVTMYAPVVLMVVGYISQLIPVLKAVKGFHKDIEANPALRAIIEQNKRLIDDNEALREEVKKQNELNKKLLEALTHIQEG